jgi:hypothetical protein
MNKQEKEQILLCIKLLKQSGNNTKQAVRLLLEDMIEKK